MTAGFSIAVLCAGHDRGGFTCGVEALDRYFREQVSQDVKRRATACYVAWMWGAAKWLAVTP